ncbi:MAG: hypothetical protein IJU56_06680 [Clostridia bacterium]|nr:hypothetical protein [Clostridia bacterium]
MNPGRRRRAQNAFCASGAPARLFPHRATRDASSPPPFGAAKLRRPGEHARRRRALWHFAPQTAQSAACSPGFAARFP